MMLWAVALISLVPVLIHLALARRRPNILEENQTKTTLHILDDNLVEYISKHSPDTCHLIVPEIINYNKYFEEIIDGFKERKFKYVRIAHVIYEKGGPNFMKLRIDAPMLLKIFGWTMNDLSELYHYLKVTNRLWLDFKEIYEEVKTAVKGNWTQLKSTFQNTVPPSARWDLNGMFHSVVDPTVLTGFNITNVPATNGADVTGIPMTEACVTSVWNENKTQV